MIAWLFKKKSAYVLFLTILLLSCNVFASDITITGPYNSVKLQKSANRIVVLEFSLLDDLLELGIKPVGIASSRVDEGTNPPFLLPKIVGITDVGTRQQPNLEKILELHPDLIVADKTMQGEIFPLLNQIAPTLLLNGLQGLPDTQILNLKLLSQATNTEDKVNAIVNKLNDAYKDAQAISLGKNSTVIVGYMSNSGQFQALTANALTSDILKTLGFNNLITVIRKEQSTPLPLETILSLNPDNIIVLLTDGQTHPYKLLTKSPLWSQLKAVRNKHVYIMDRDIWAKNHGILATLLLLKEAKESGFLTGEIHNNS